MLTAPVDSSSISYPHMVPLASHMNQLHLHQSVRHAASRMIMRTTKSGSCLKTGQHFIFAIINLLLTIKCIIFDFVSKILFIFFIANNNNYDSNIKNILLHNGYKIINLRYPTYMYQFIIFLIITKIECWPVFKQDPQKHKQCCMFISGKRNVQKIIANMSVE